MSLTETQLKAVSARGNVVLVAGAGTGKTHTLVERCLACLVREEPRVSLDELLMVTFTEAAAAEMRQRIRARLEEEAGCRPGEVHWQEQLAMFETANIGTLHSFCLKLIREHFYLLELDPQVTVLAEEEAQLLANETLEALLQKHYGGSGPEAIAVQQLIQSQGRGWDKPIRGLIMKLHHYTQTLPNPGEWLRSQREMFSNPAPAAWQEWLMPGAIECLDRWRPVLKTLAPENRIAANCMGGLEGAPALESRAQLAKLLSLLAAEGENCPNGKKAAWLKPLERFFKDVHFLRSVADGAGKSDPLAEDWTWVRMQMLTLAGLVQEFTEAFAEAKHELGVVDFQDLEQHALRLLWDTKSNQPTPIASQWRNKLRFVFVDEYQDINAAQDKIIQALSGVGAQANRFLVGDVKQSIYRFRQANPRIFQDYVQRWEGPEGMAIPLVENFRSREGLLLFANSLFSTIMHPAAGGVAYDQSAQLNFGSPHTRKSLSAAADPEPRVELHLRFKQKNSGEEEQNGDALAEVRDLDEADKEARLVARRLSELHRSRHRIWDEDSHEFRPVAWRDMAVLLRSPSGKAESYAKEFGRLGVPLQVERGGFYQSLEISDLVSLLQVLDNPLQDIPVLAVLHSPLVGLTSSELAAIRLAAPRAHFWTALIRWNEKELNGPTAGESNPVRIAEPVYASTETRGKVGRFLERFAKWRRLARQVSLSRCLEAVLAETHYADWLLAQIRGDQRYANVQSLLSLAQRFDQFQRQGLFRFLRFVEAQRTAEAEPAVSAAANEDAVRLMSIHQSKGLEFPVVAVADLGKPFNQSDLRAEIILDDQFGICPQVKPPHTGKRYPSLPYWLARPRQWRELLGEEVRLLYVATTRARDTLLLSGCISVANCQKFWKTAEEATIESVLSCRSYADLLGIWFARNCGGLDIQKTEGTNPWLRWTLHDDAELATSIPADLKTGENASLETMPDDSGAWKALEQKLSWQYPFMAATQQPSKSSVSELRRRAAELDEEAVELAPENAQRSAPERAGRNPNEARKTPSRNGKRRAADVGIAHHLFLQFVALAQTESLLQLQEEGRRLAKEGILKPGELERLDFDALAGFWSSELGQRIRTKAGFVRRELPFTARFKPVELSDLMRQGPIPGLDNEFVVVQGVADLVVLLDDQIWLLDFKTDAIVEADLENRARLYAPQITLYSRALSRIYRRPVSECWLYFLSCRKQMSVMGGT